MKLTLSLLLVSIATLHAIVAHAADTSAEREQMPEKRFYAWDGGDPSSAKRKCGTRK